MLKKAATNEPSGSSAGAPVSEKVIVSEKLIAARGVSVIPRIIPISNNICFM